MQCETAKCTVTQIYNQHLEHWAAEDLYVGVYYHTITSALQDKFTLNHNTTKIIFFLSPRSTLT